ncbi:hypothetical protein EHS17_03865 [Rhodobacteraceae bacterium CH30]|nr:hypothetical protein EHS17_03865 [Rhodobacteraceae bacterium CH30]
MANITQAHIDKHYAFIKSEHPRIADDLDSVIAMTEAIEFGSARGVPVSEAADKYFEAFAYANAMDKGNLSEFKQFNNGYDPERNQVNAEWTNSDSQNLSFSMDMDAVKVDSVTRNTYGQDIHHMSNPNFSSFEVDFETDHKSMGASLVDMGNGNMGFGNITVNGFDAGAQGYEFDV